MPAPAIHDAVPHLIPPLGQSAPRPPSHRCPASATPARTPAGRPASPSPPSGPLLTPLGSNSSPRAGDPLLVCKLCINSRVCTLFCNLQSAFPLDVVCAIHADARNLSSCVCNAAWGFATRAHLCYWTSVVGRLLRGRSRTGLRARALAGDFLEPVFRDGFAAS